MALKHYRPNLPLYILIATANQADQLLISQRFPYSLPSVKVSCATTSQQTLQYLTEQEAEFYCFPQLLILDAQIDKPEIVWQLLHQMQVNYPFLPIVLISTDHRSDIIEQAYQSGARAFINKAVETEQWEQQVSELADYWLNLVSLPKQVLL